MEYRTWTICYLGPLLGLAATASAPRDDATAGDLARTASPSGLGSPAGGIAPGGGHTCTALSDGRVKCWGDNAFGQLGDGSTVPSRFTPGEVTGLSGVVQVVSGNHHACALIGDGTVRCWGQNSVGQLGDGTRIDSSTPVAVAGLNAVIQISSFLDHTCAVLSDGSARCWGDNSHAQLGDGTTGDRSSPVQVLGLSDVVEIAAGSFHTCARSVDGTASCWGANNEGAIGAGLFDPTVISPTAVLDVSDVVQIAAGANHSCAVLTDGRAYCWGMNATGQLGDGTIDTPRRSPVQVSGAADFEQIAPGGDHTCARRGGGIAVCWGANSRGQLGDHSAEARRAPVQVTSLGSIDSIAASADHSCAVTSAGSVKCWGSNASGKLGRPTTPQPTLTPLVGFSGAVQIDNRFGRVCALQPSGSIICWSEDTDPIPAPVPGLTDVASLALSGRHACVLRTGGTVSCWGTNEFGQLGDGTGRDSATPVAVSGLTNVRQVVTGSVHSCAVLTDGTVRCWGWNDGGRIGDGMPGLARLTPVVVPGLSNVEELTAGDGHTCARITDGTVRCWGLNNWGQLGDGTTINRSAHQPVSGLTDAAHITSSFSHGCALLRDGTARCWGSNNWGQLGGGTAAPSLTPVTVTLTNITQIVVGAYHTCAVVGETSAECWGYNTVGMLGDGTFVDRLTPVPLLGFAPGARLSADFFSTWTRLLDGTLRACGRAPGIIFDHASVPLDIDLGP